MAPAPGNSTMTHVGEDGGRAADGAAPVLALALEADRPLAGSARHSLARIDLVTIGRADSRTVARGPEGDAQRLALGIPDRWASSAHARLTRVLGRWVIEDVGSKNGTLVNGEPVQRAELADGDVIEVGHTFFVLRLAMAGARAAAEALDSAALGAAPLGLRTLSGALAEDFARLGAIARSEVSVYVRGETGTGKELAARAVHALSGRRGGFVAVNCGALPANLAASELFGHRRGAFSGASDDRLGLVRSADGGTLFLDEIGDLPLEAQPALLRVLQEREVVPVGAERPYPVDLRVVSASHRDLGALVGARAFRADLHARLSGFTLTLPPLRERREEIGLLVADVLRTALGRGAERVRFTADAARLLLAHDWPLNVRELEKCLGAAVVLAGDGPVKVEHLPESVRGAAERARPTAADEPAAPRAPRPLTEAEQQHREELVALLREHGGNVSAVARATGKARMQIQRWLKRYGLDPESFRP